MEDFDGLGPGVPFIGGYANTTSMGIGGLDCLGRDGQRPRALCKEGEGALIEMSEKPIDVEILF